MERSAGSLFGGDWGIHLVAGISMIAQYWNGLWANRVASVIFFSKNVRYITEICDVWD